MDIVNSFEIEGEVFYFYDLKKVFSSNKRLKNLPIVLKILLESNLRKATSEEQFNNIINIFENRRGDKINFYPSRLVLEEFSELPIFIDLAVLRDKVNLLGADVKKVNPQILIDLIIDNSFLEVEDKSLKDKEINLVEEKYHFIKWASKNFTNLRIIPPGSGICNQVNLEFLSTILHVERKENKFFLYPETILGTDSHATMINSLGVLGFRIDSIESQLAILGLPIKIDFPKVIGINIFGKLNNAVTSSDLITYLIEKLKASNINGELVEFFGEGLEYLTLEDRSFISVAAPKYNASCSYFAIDNKTIRYFNKTRGNEDYGKLIKSYLENQELFFSNENLDYDKTIEFDLSSVYPNIKDKKNLNECLTSLKSFPLMKKGDFLKDGDIVLSILITSKLSLHHLIHSLLLAKKAVELGIKVKKNINAKFVIDTNIKKEHLESLDLIKYIDELGFEILYDNYIFNTNEIDEDIKKDILKNNLNLCSISSQNIDFLKNSSNLIKSNYITSSSLVVFFSLVGNVKFDFENDIIEIIDNKAVYLKDIWPTNREVVSYLGKVDYTLYKEIYKDIYKGNEFWQNLDVELSGVYNWNPSSTYIQALQIISERDAKHNFEIEDAEILSLFGDYISTEQILPSKNISLYSPTARYLEEKGVKSFEYNDFESRCGNFEVMIRNLFDTSSIKNLMISKEGAYTIDYENSEIVPIFEKALKSKSKNISQIIIAGKEFGKGKTKYWAIRALKIIGVEVILAKSFDEKYRKHLINFGILPLEFIDDDIESLKLKGDEKFTITSENIKEKSILDATIKKGNIDISIELKCRLDNFEEIKHYKEGGVLNLLFKNILNDSL
ncbi:aconitase family protein [Halarcobacter sp.]|uniref:aconitase family protein n=1 Tax=Halarcobacter sp. TaxID=2321133 RepID=UPI0029F56FAB|nr:aconitase family protein [Halarcobacter sp.]